MPACTHTYTCTRNTLEKNPYFLSIKNVSDYVPRKNNEACCIRFVSGFDVTVWWMLWFSFFYPPARYVITNISVNFVFFFFFCIPESPNFFHTRECWVFVFWEIYSQTQQSSVQLVSGTRIQNKWKIFYLLQNFWQKNTTWLSAFRKKKKISKKFFARKLDFSRFFLINADFYREGTKIKRRNGRACEKI